jgi:hypothetical protein
VREEGTAGKGTKSQHRGSGSRLEQHSEESTMLRKDEDFDDCENMALESNGYPLQ